MELSQSECDFYQQNWIDGVTSAVCRITNLPRVRALALAHRCKFNFSKRFLLTELEKFGIPNTSRQAREFCDYWLNADDDRSE